jgi:hypothetical protein
MEVKKIGNPLQTVMGGLTVTEGVGTTTTV